MTMTDPIADMLTRVRNANSAGKPTVSMPSRKRAMFRATTSSRASRALRSRSR